MEMREIFKCRNGEMVCERMECNIDNLVLKILVEKER